MDEKMLGKFVIVRTYTAGVHCGILKEHSGIQVILESARRIYRWRGANTLSELSKYGADMEWTRISESVPEILLTEAIEIIPCTNKAIDNLTKERWG